MVDMDIRVMPSAWGQDHKEQTPDLGSCMRYVCTGTLMWGSTVSSLSMGCFAYATLRCCDFGFA